MKLNSAPDLKNGKFYQWIDNKRMVSLDAVCWFKSGMVSPEINFFSIGGNDWFHTYPDSQQRTEWLSYDNLIIRHNAPEGAE